jgi:hypothetical protein
MRALTERPACFEIGPRGVRSSAPIGYGCRTQLITAYNCGSISSSRCQTTCIAAIDEINAIQIRCMDELPVRSRRQPELVEPDGIEPTTSCLQSRRSPN